MFEFPDQLKYAALEFLGHAPDTPFPVVRSFRTQADLDNATARLSDLLDKLALCQSQIELALPDSMAVKLDTLEVNYGKHLALLNQHGYRLLVQLSDLVGLPIKATYFKRHNQSRLV